MQIFYKAKNGKSVSLEINPEETMQQTTEKIQDKGGIRPCNVIPLRLILVVIVEILVCKSFSVMLRCKYTETKLIKKSIV